jgi:hypothetical protein
MMGNIKSQRLQNYYDEYKSTLITFSKEIIQVTGLQTKQVVLKCGTDTFPCLVYSASLEEAKILATNKYELIEKLKEVNGVLSVVFCFKVPPGDQTVTFTISARAVSFANYGSAADLSMFTLKFSQRPPDEFIGIMGRIFEANASFSVKRDERILITAETMDKLRFAKKEADLTVEGVPRRGIFRDISFSGARIVIIGIAKFLIDKSASIKFGFTEPDESYSINGKFVGARRVAGRNDMLVMDMAYNEPVPMAYKVRLSDYLNSDSPLIDTEAQTQAEVAVTEV